MTEPEEPRWSDSDPDHNASKSEEFRETLSPPMPNRTYRNEVDLIDDQPSVLVQLVRYIAAVLIVLVSVRFVIDLIAPVQSGAWASFFYLTTDWLVQPIQRVLGQSYVGISSGYIDWAALAAIVVIALIAWIITLVLHPRSS